MKRVLLIVAALVLAGCAGLNRSCSSIGAGAFGGDWVIAQFAMDGSVFNCWTLKNVSVSNETNSDGIYWLESGHLVHISGWYNRVQVSGGRFDEAAKTIGVVMSKCTNGHYSP